MLERFQRPWERGRSEIDNVWICKDARKQFQLIDVDTSQTFSQCQHGETAMVGQLSVVTVPDERYILDAAEHGGLTID